MTKPTELLLIDLSGIFWPIWSMQVGAGDLSVVTARVVEDVNAIAKDHPMAVVCCDSGRTFRHDLDPTYKANRTEKAEALWTHMHAVEETLRRDGFLVWAVKGFEADDLIASAVTLARKDPGIESVLIAAVDKDLLALVGRDVNGDVVVLNTREMQKIGESGVVSRLNVLPSQVVDYLTLKGDEADNIKGAPGIGPKGAATLLAKYGSLDAFYEQFNAKGGSGMGLSVKQATVMRDFQPRLANVRKLVQMRTDVPLPWEDLVKPRPTRAEAKQDTSWDQGGDEYKDEPEDDQDLHPPSLLGILAEADQTTNARANPQTEREPEVKQDGVHAGASQEAVKGLQGPEGPSGPPGDTTRPEPPKAQAAFAEKTLVGAPGVLPSASLVRVTGKPTRMLPDVTEMGIQPRNYREVRIAAGDLFNSAMFLKDYGTKEAVLSTIMLGRELGLPAMGSLRGIFIVEGRHTLSAQLMVALILKSGLAEYFEPLHISDKTVTYETRRRGDRAPMQLTHTIEMATRAGLVKPNSNWVKVPEDMLVSRCSARLARIKYPDLLFGLYTPEEVREINEAENERRSA
jgi:5'-3' exonuclease